METQLSLYGSRKGKQNSFRQMLSSIAGKSLQLFPVPGLDVFLAKGMNPHQKGVTIASTPRHANVLLVTSPLPENLVQYVANVYAQMPRPRLLVAVATEINDPLPPPDVELTDEDLNQIYQKVSFAHTWIEEALPYDLSTLEREGEAIYTCPMHMEVKSDKPGNCPICGMRLVKQEGEKQPNDSLAEQNEKHRYNQEPRNEMELHSSQPDSTGSQDKVTYTCPMHPDVVSNQPGNCPICGMNLVKAEPQQQLKDNPSSQGKEHAHQEHIQQDSGDQDKTTYTCPMHPEVKSDQPGKCPKCCMNLVPESATPGDVYEMKGMDKTKTFIGQGNDDKSDVYTCPMHPEVQSDKPGNCPKCGMNLVKQEHTEHQMNMTHKHEGHKMNGNEMEMESNAMKEQKMQVDEMEGHDMKGHEMKDNGMEGHDMSSMSGGFMSMVQMTRNLPRSKDGLAMETNDAFFGPFHPGLPGGLLVKMQLDGDTVVKADVDKKILSRNLLQDFSDEPVHLPDYLSQTNPLLHQTYRLLAFKALVKANGNNGIVDEVAILERDRIGSHLNWLSIFSKTVGDRALYNQASKLCYEWQSGGANRTAIQKLTGKIKSTPYLKTMVR